MRIEVPEPPSSAAPKVALAHYLEKIGPALDRMIHAAEATKTDVANGCGIHRPHLYDMLEGHRKFPLAAAFLLPASVRVLLAEAIAGPGYTVVEAPSVENMDDAFEDLDAAQSHASRVVHEALGAFRDGIIDRQEGARLEQAADLGVRALTKIRELGKLARVHGVQGVPRRTH